MIKDQTQDATTLHSSLEQSIREEIAREALGKAPEAASRRYIILTQETLQIAVRAEIERAIRMSVMEPQEQDGTISDRDSISACFSPVRARLSLLEFLAAVGAFGLVALLAGPLLFRAVCSILVRWMYVG